MPINIKKVSGAELNREELERLRTTPTGTMVMRDEDRLYTVIDMTDATQEEQGAFMEKRRQEYWNKPDFLTSRFEMANRFKRKPK